MNGIKSSNTALKNARMSLQTAAAQAETAAGGNGRKSSASTRKKRGAKIKLIDRVNKPDEPMRCALDCYVGMLTIEGPED
ncbi:putative ADP-ribosylation factor protein [Pseudomonas sp. St290]|nr:putative ADP-ribosylation factor protein [Pseudomonas sp. St290]